jgi:glutamate-1-semialdehyde aminotransferase
MLERGFLLPPAQFEAAFLSMSHTLEDVQGFVTAAREVLTQLKDQPAPSSG